MRSSRRQRALARAGTPIVLLPGGTTGSSARAALSHTGALVSDSRAIDAACAAAGIVRVATPTQLIDAAQALLAGRLLRGRRVAVYADGGGHGVVASDVLAAAGLDVPALSPSTTAALGGLLPATASLANPVDFAGGGERGLTAYADVGRVLLRLGRRRRGPAHRLFRRIRRRHAGARGRRGRDRAGARRRSGGERRCARCADVVPRVGCGRRAASRRRGRVRRCCLGGGDARDARRRWRKPSRLRRLRAASRTSRRPGPATGPPVPSSPKQACR